MDINDYVTYDAIGLAELIRSGQVSAEEVQAAALAAVAVVNPHLNAVAGEPFDTPLAHNLDGPLAGVPLGRPLFAANAALPHFDDPVEQLWQLCTTLREHRGDGHVAALAAAGIDGCQAHQLLIAEQGLPPDLFFDNRGWDDDQQRRSLEVLVSRGLIEGTTLTELGADLRDQIEAITDERAAEPFNEALDEDDLARLDAVLTPLAEAVQASGVIPFPNPMGLPEL